MCDSTTAVLGLLAHVGAPDVVRQKSLSRIVKRHNCRTFVSVGETRWPRDADGFT
jgi:hypothetical protein